MKNLKCAWAFIAFVFEHHSKKKRLCSTTMKRIPLFALMMFILTACSSDSPSTTFSQPILKLQCDACNTEPLRTDIAISNQNFSNPERGFYQQSHISITTNLDQEFSATYLSDLHDLNISLLHLYFNLEPFLNQDISQDFLVKIQSVFAMARQHGFKVIPRFTYNDPNEQTFENAQDANPGRINQHLDQLAPLLQQNNDVIAFMEAGFVGAWGEWHDSSNGLITEEATGKTIGQNAKNLLKKILQTLPKNRMVLVRYPQIKHQAFGDTPLSATESYDNSDRARIGAHNDCFLASSSDRGTYSEEESIRITEKNYLMQDSHFVPQSGETCSNDSRAQAYTSCDNALSELSRMHYSALHIGYNQDVLQRWRFEHCFDEIALRLGYRFALNWFRTPEWAKRSEQLILELDFQNLGFATPYNERPMELVLANSTHTFRIPLYTDVRRWTPGENHHVYRNLELPKDLPSGEYNIGLAMPDADPTLATRPEYAIRLANQMEWRNGINWLGRTINIFE